MSEMKMTDEDDRLGRAFSRIAEKCAKPGDWSWLDAVRCCEHRLLVLFRRTVRKTVDDLMEVPTVETICHELQDRFYRVLWPVFDEAQRTACRTWILTLALKSFSNDKASAITVSDDEEESEKDEEERVDNESGSSPAMSYDSPPSVDHDHVSSSPPHPPAEMTPEAKPVAEPNVHLPSISIGVSAAAAAVAIVSAPVVMIMDESVPSSPPQPVVEVHAPPRSLSQTEEQERFEEKLAQARGESYAVPPQPEATGSSEPPSQSAEAAFDSRVSPDLIRLAEVEDQEAIQAAAVAAAMSPPPRGGGKVRPQLPEPASRQAQAKRQKVVRHTADLAISLQQSPARSTRSSDKKTRSGHGRFTGLAD